MLALAVAGSGVLSGCDAADLLDAPAPEPPAPDADERLADELATRVADARAVALRVPEAAWFVRAHDAHLEALGAEPTASPSATASPAPATMADLRAVEAELQRALAGGAVRAEDAGLARTLAAMSAGVAQLVAVTPR